MQLNCSFFTKPNKYAFDHKTRVAVIASVTTKDQYDAPSIKNRAQLQKKYLNDDINSVIMSQN